jgi:nucleoside-diphosphate-sugar epimerase
MKLLLTGASGFVGRNFLRHAPPGLEVVAVYCKDHSFRDFVDGLQKPNITTFLCDLSAAESVSRLFQHHGHEWDCCLYLAGKVDIPWSVREPKSDLMLNTGSLLNILEGIRADRFVYFSSGAVYDGLRGEVHPEAPVSPTLPYAISKMTCERYVEAFRQRKGTIQNYLNVRFFGAYGPYEAPHKLYTRLIQAFSGEGRSTYTVYGDGQNLIDAMYIDDTIDAIQRILRGGHWNRTLNLAAGAPITIEALVREVGEALGVSSMDIEKQGVANEKNLFWGSTQEMRDLFGFQPTVRLSEGITRFRDFLLVHQ